MFQVWQGSHAEREKVPAVWTWHLSACLR